MPPVHILPSCLRALVHLTIQSSSSMMSSSVTSASSWTSSTEEVSIFLMIWLRPSTRWQIYWLYGALSLILNRLVTTFFFILLLSGTQSGRFIAKSLSILSLNVSVFLQFHKKLLFDSYLFKFWLVFSQNVGPFALPLYTQVYKW